MKRALVLLVVAACQTQTGDDSFPISPGGGNGNPGTGGSGTADGGLDADDDAGTTIEGRICLLTDLRKLSTCAATGADKITVTLGTKSTTTAVDGRFTIGAPAGTNLVWHAFDTPPTLPGTNFATAAMPFSTTNVIPTMTAQTFLDLQNANGVLLSPGEGTIVAGVLKANAPLVDGVASVLPASQFAPLYDNDLSASQWDLNNTDKFGIVWIPGARLGNNAVKVTPPGGSPLTTVFVVEDQTITFGTIDVP